MSWVAGADGSPYGVHNLPYGVFVHGGRSRSVGVRDRRLRPRPRGAGRARACSTRAARCAGTTLNAFMALGRPRGTPCARGIVELLTDRVLPGRRRAAADPGRRRDACGCRSRSPTTSTSTPPSTTRATSARSSGPGSRRCTRTGSTCRSATTAGPARSSSPARRSSGRAASASRRRAAPTVGPSVRLDIEAEVGFVVGVPTGSVHRCRSTTSRDHVFGVVLRQRLVRPRHPGLGVRAARPVPRQVVRHLDLGVGGAAGRARRRARAGAGAGPGRARLPARDRTGPGLDLDLTVDVERQRRVPAAVRPHVLDAGAATRAPDRQRRVAAHRRPVRLRHGLRPRARPRSVRSWS